MAGRLSRDFSQAGACSVDGRLRIDPVVHESFVAPERAALSMAAMIASGAE